MPMFSSDMPSIQKSFLAVGQFMHSFSGMDDELNRSLRSLLGLGILEGAIVTSNIDVRSKVYMILTAFNIRPMKEEDWIRDARTDLKSVVKMSERRNILAHNSFVDRPNGVEFFYTKAKGNLKLPDEFWSYDDFDGYYNEMGRLTNSLRTMTEKVVKHPATALRKAISETMRNLRPNEYGAMAAMFEQATADQEP